MATTTSSKLLINYQVFYKVLTSSLFDFFLGFLLVFIATYGLLYKVNLFRNNRIHVLIAAGFALLFTYSLEVYKIAERLASTTSYVLLASVSVMMLIAMFTGTASKFSKGFALFIGLILASVVYYDIYRTFIPVEEGNSVFGQYISDELLAVIIVLVILLLVIMYVTYPEEESKKKKLKKFLRKMLEEMLEETNE